MKTYSVHGLLLILLIGWGEAALTRNVMTGRSEQRPSSERISQGESSTPNTAQPDSEQPTKNSKEGIVGPVVGAYGGYTGNHAHPIGMNTYGYGVPNNYSPNNPILDVSSNGGLTLSAYFGPVFWGFLVGLVVVIVIIAIINAFSGFEHMSAAIRSIGDGKGESGSGKGKSLDLDQITSLVYAAMDKYSKWNSKTQNNVY